MKTTQIYIVEFYDNLRQWMVDRLYFDEQSARDFVDNSGYGGTIYEFTILAKIDDIT